jgi:hypothetical protein
MGVSLHLLTKGATVNIFPNVGTKARPPKVSLNKFLSFKTTGVPRSGVVMEAFE